ncbi:SRPBCC family protein [Streptomyces sp. ICBB 8177]|uniref:SRPBCC family protein n=1 Tax=Streptomyces sp. ICBB 8177 TaxID=563922 RepID=UPI000D684ACB|nr:SRPBCC family protein [Streptomyces sp. ICBB 8177]PWI42055.1 polyketide cyclase [Streptomyces sp. ICBB 8177]
MDWCRYRFRSVWRLAAPVEAVYAVLADPEGYPRWWPQVREVDRIDEVSGTMRFRSLLPYDLVVGVRQVLRSPDDAVLQVAMSGDLEGWVRWTLTPDGSGCRALYEQRVVVRKPLMRRLALPGRPFFLVNHAVMMRRGLGGLRAALAGRPRDAV